MAIPGLHTRTSRRSPRAGFTLVEMLVAVGLTVLMMTMVVTVFGLVMDSIHNSRGAVEVNDRLRAAKNRLQLDLAGLTAPVTMPPPLNPALGLGYFEYVEGPIGPVVSYLDASGSDNPNDTHDSTAGDRDDMLMFTIVSNGEPFVGRKPVLNAAGDTIVDYTTVQSQVAEVAWFLRGTTLYRRVLLVYSPPDGLPLPTAQQLTGQNLYQYCDISLHAEGDPTNLTTVRLVPNTLGDLTKRENRFAHQSFAWPYDARCWGNLGLPTLEECAVNALDYGAATQVASASDPSNRSIFFPAQNVQGNAFNRLNASNAMPDYHSQRLDLRYDPSFPYRFDAWRTPHPAVEQDHTTGQIVLPGTSMRVGEDVILTDAIGFDVKVWDPGAPILADRTSPNSEVIMPSDPPTTLADDLNLHPPALITSLRLFTDGNPSNDPVVVGFGAYVDLNYLCGLGPDGNTIPTYDTSLLRASMSPPPPVTVLIPEPQFHHAGDVRSGLWGTFPTVSPSMGSGNVQELFESLRASVYDTYSTHYETDGINQANVPWNPAVAASTVPPVDAGTNGLDDNGDGAVDEASAYPNTTAQSPLPAGFAGEKETAPPYPHPLRGIQIKIRVFEPGTRQVREVTLEHEFISQ